MSASAASSHDPGCNPSAWMHRLVLAGLAVVGAAVAGYLTLVETDVLSHAWDPFTGDGSDRVLHSSFSSSLPFPDAGLGLLAYLAEVVLALVGPEDRWRRMPWVVLVFDAVLLGAATGGLVLLVVQAAVVHHYCTLCLVSTGISVTALGLSRLRESRAALRRLRQQPRADRVDALLHWPGTAPPVGAVRIAEARAMTAASLTALDGAALVVLPISAYAFTEPGVDAVWRDLVLGTALVLWGVAGLRAPLRARRSGGGTLLAGGVLIGSALLFDGQPDGVLALRWWTEVSAGLVALVAGGTQLLSTAWARHLVRQRGIPGR
ncbi:vitamin K epoxide reductase family protein [Motilibacter peucedani]|uniref:Vitamin K epoxide reductase family protein n=1 Tax=Motilibacter peucedani TaxID=598650 RepID=A0A420XQJ0_9ACTN|nr:vitamin K epoxide reductase family protein [Motilibacter peucedani]RKS75563.1 vitamin K epoxide reductase family protein [Motilibacter peucedani]